VRISAITASIPSRPGKLAEAMESVRRQTLQPDEHLVAVDHARRGTARVLTQLALAARNEWVATLDDDDLWYADHLATLAANSADADIVYSWCHVEGRPGFEDYLHREFDAAALCEANYIPNVALIRRELVADLGGWRYGVANDFEDYDFWLRALAAGARFVCVPEVTWRYRLHEGSKTVMGERAAA
jgi:glycosyltransferase involved in cell wall biosynthesis